MGRRAPRKVDPSLDLSHHLRTPADLARPLRAAELFGRQAPLEIEVGSGKGLFILSASAAAPDANFLGIEIAGKYARFAASRLARAGRSNAVILQGDAIQVFDELLLDQSVAATHVYFPDPWWKKRHRKRRVLNERFLSHVERVLAQGGTLHFWTDVEEYFRSTVDLIAHSTALAGPFQVAPRPAEHDLDYRTHFERRMRLHDCPVYRVVFRKL
jgi:tRNA (guanine-N7-)-methyltransferase